MAGDKVFRDIDHRRARRGEESPHGVPPMVGRGAQPVDQFPKINNLRSAALRLAVDSVAPAPVELAVSQAESVLVLAARYEEYLRGKQ